MTTLLLGTKYTWLGNGYLSSFYYKLIASRPVYHAVFHNIQRDRWQKASGKNFPALGDVDGKPLSATNWRVDCNKLWNTTVGGPCFVRNTRPECPDDNPASYKILQDCLQYVDAKGNFKVKNDTWCEGTTFTKDGIQVGGKSAGLGRKKWEACWFGLMIDLPYELGFYNKMGSDPDTLRPNGCKGLDSGIMYKAPRFGSPVMHCDKNDYAS